MQHIADLLKSKKLKVTPQRIAIFKILYDSTEHPSAEHIYKCLQSTHPTMSLATVYKTLDTLKKAELVQEFNVGEDSFRYDANVNVHPHMVCLKCKKVFDLDTDKLNNIKSLAQEETDFNILSEKIFFYGICAQCKQ
ncbi:MAG: transcriptional repressor [Vallitalea sp.]|jgi:Fur family peroxide stress response transcriptional regulator|nr:transcriptional repressor [Vallitalea sp.]